MDSRKIIYGDAGLVGTFALSIVTFVASFNKLGYIDTMTVVPVAFMFGGLLKFYAGTIDLKNHNGLAAYGNLGFGIFWMFYALVHSVNYFIPGTFAPETFTLTFMALILFSVGGVLQSLKIAKVTTTIWILIVALFIFLTASGLTGNHAFGLAAGYTELAIALLGFYVIIAKTLNEVYGKVILPTGKPFVK